MTQPRRASSLALPLAALLAATAAVAQTPPAAKAPPPEPGTLYVYPERIPLEDGGFARADRGLLFVPAVRADPGSPVLAVEFYRFARTPEADPSAPPIFLLHGGPGWPGLEPALRQAGEFEREIRPWLDVSDLVVVGQRGIGFSKPNTLCEAPAPTDPGAVESEAERRRAVQDAARRCIAFWRGTDVPLEAFSVIEAAADVDQLRAALGYDRLTLMGNSFGSHWSMAVLRFHGDHVARAFLAGMEGPDHTWDSPSGVLNAIAGLAAAADTARALRGHVPPGGLLHAFREVIRRAEQAPLEVTVEGEEGRDVRVRLDADDIRALAYGTTGHASSRRGMRTWPADVIALYRGDYEGAARRKLGGGGSPTASFFMLDCGSGITRERWRRLAADTAIATVGDLSWFYDTACEIWPADLGDAFRTGFVTRVPTLIVQGSWDTSTPMVNALELRGSFPNSHMVLVEGGSHGAPDDAMELVPGFRREIEEFLSTGELRGLPERVALPPVDWVVPPGRASAQRP